MGLLSFLARRNDRAQEAPVKHQAYHSTVASFPPVRGTLPVSGNGPVSYEQLRRAAAKKRSQPQMSVPLKPFFLGTRDDRPSSAPYEDSPEWRPKSSGRNPRDAIRGFQFPLVSNHSLGKRHHRYDADSDSLTPSLPSTTAHGARDGSLGPARSTTRHVDILDAQGDLKPYDFRSRVRAAGVRDYGEDVADRNMDQNAIQLATPAVQASRSSSVRGDLPLREKNRNSRVSSQTVRQVVAMPAIARPEEQQLPMRKGGQKRNSLTLVASTDELEKKRQLRAQRTMSLDANTMLSLPEGYLSHNLSVRQRRGTEDLRAESRRSDRSKSRERAASPRVWISRERREPDGELREYSRSHLGSPIVEFPSSSRSALPPAIPRYRPRTAQGVAAEHSIPSPASTVWKTRHSERSRSRGVDTEHRARTPSSTSRQGYRARDRQADTNSLHSNVSYVNRRREYIEQLDAPQEATSSDEEGSLSDSAPAPLVSNRRGEGSHTSAHSRQGSHLQWESPWSHIRADPLYPQRGPSDLAADVVPHSRNRSWSCLPAIPSRARVNEYAGYIPARRSSLRQWSVSSITPTTELSDYSSIPAARRHSTHTPNTSVDAAFSVVSAKPPEPVGRSGSYDRPESSAYLTAQEDDDVHTDTTTTSRPASRAAPFDNGVEDDLDSEGEGEGEGEDGDGLGSEDSDVDSFMEKRLEAQRGQDDESLLFKEADLGNDLPGLLESAAPKQPCLMCSLLQCAAVDPPYDACGTGTWATRPPCDHKDGITRRDRLRALGYEYETDESHSEAESQTDREQESATPRGRTPTQRAGRRDEKPDPPTLSVPKQRRDGNRRVSSRLDSQRRSLAIEPVMEDEEGHAADVE